MASDTAVVTAKPRPWLLILLAIAAVLFLVNWMWPTNSATPAVAASNQQRADQKRDPGKIDPADLDIHLEVLTTSRAEAGSSERNPFRFQPKAPPPPPPSAVVPVTPALPPGGAFTPPPGPPPPPPIPLKFIGIVEKQGLKVAAMSDCRMTYYGTEGQVIDGRYRLIKIGVESMMIEDVDGQGRTTVRLEGCPAR